MLKMVFATILCSLSISASAASQCGGTCVGTSGNQFYNSACAGASVNGQQACQKYSGLGCVWYEKVAIPGRCVGTTGNEIYASACAGASVNGQKACEKYSGLGCAWIPGYCQ